MHELWDWGGGGLWEGGWVCVCMWLQYLQQVLSNGNADVLLGYILTTGGEY